MLPWGRDDRLLIEQIKRFITTAGRRPFFLVGMTSNPHHPYAVDHLPSAPEVADDTGRNAYERLVEYDVGLVAELYDWMKQRGIAERTLVLVLGDHGEAFGEHAGNFGHAAFIYDENVHIPCFILHPRRLGLPRRIAQLGSQVDLRATIMDIIGMHDTEPSDGMSLLRTDPDRQVINFTENGVSHFGVRDSALQLHLYAPGWQRAGVRPQRRSARSPQHRSAGSPDHGALPPASAALGCRAPAFAGAGPALVGADGAPIRSRSGRAGSGCASPSRR